MTAPYLAANPRVKSPAVHISVNPSPGDVIGADTLVHISDDYMQQKSMACRSFLLRHMRSFGEAYQSALLVEFSRQHYPQQTEKIVRRHTETYNKKYQRIQKQLEALRQQQQAEATPAG